MDRSVLERAREVFDIEVEGINYLRDRLSESFAEMVERCAGALDRGGKLVITGIGKSGYIGKKMAATLSSVGSPAIFMHPVEARHGDLGILQKNDLLIALSYSGETEELLVVLNPAKRLGVELVSITGNAESTLAKMSDLAVAMPVPREACSFGLVPTTTTTALLVLGDALAMVLLDKRGFTKNDFGRLHPGGAIGRMVTMRACDMMRPLERTALVSADRTVRDAICEMGRVRGGSAVVVDDESRLLGIFTDGDFRRLAEKGGDPLSLKMRDVMTANPVSVDADMLAVEVMKILEKRKIDDLVVTGSDGKVAGTIDIQDLPGMKML
ncbi:MAG: KpsF/GutQ family sugar-phosphate isomerase [Victivallaceae bacterium]|nr:KpsF/GutQ family sugar-phosphate isomerase [Victivallaceae bacterium]